MCVKSYGEKLRNNLSEFYPQEGGLGTIQWTKSKLIKYENKAKNQEGTCAHTEIITELLDSHLINKRQNKKYSVFNKSQQNCLQERSTECESYTFNSGQKWNERVSTAQDLIEAKQFSLIMAHRTLKTICLEEPDRGMHPQMIKRKKEVLNHESRHKTIIVVIQSPYPPDSISLKNIFFFSRKYDVAFDVVNIYMTNLRAISI